ncbi:hypothetical protein Q5P01_023336 [Channa striata]|uniref:Alpha-tectorin n=1 Tax=Channa striata TaxID=64152 RepID=A0AA88IW59_CHASR|nr:hypothetical protein Q5P01_023336 [Channa striata]
MNGVARRTEFTVACLISNNNSEMRATVNQNGHLTFDGPWESYIPQRFPMYGLRDIIAPFWTNLFNAQIYYNQYTGGSVLQQATEDISKYFSILNFNAKWVFVASWYEVAYYPTLERAGYDTINSTHYFMIPGSFSNSASGGNSNFHLSSNVNVPGRWAFHVGHVSGSCIFKGATVQQGDSFWSDSTCAQKCTCTSSGLQCVNQPCSFSQVCQPSAFQFSCQSVQKGLCTISGDPHYYTFDNRAFDFQGTCTYVLSEQCGGELSYYRVESKNEHRGSTHVSWTRLVKVHVYNETIELVKGQLGKVKVNGNFAGTPLYLYPRNGSIQVYESGFSIIVSTDFGLEVSYDTDHYVQISLPYTYQNSTCGLCGDFNNDPRDDFRTRQGQVHGRLIRLPYSSASNQIQIYYSSIHSVILRTSFGVTVQTVWPSFVRVTAPGVYNNSLAGLCGNYNGHPSDDFQTPNGTLVNSVQVFGDSWRNGFLSPQCVESRSSNSPTNTTEYCGILELSQGPFANCWEAVDRWEHVNICDNTVRTSNNPAVELCDILHDLALMCQQNGVVLGSWRNVTGCESTCPPNSHYELCGTSCPSTCPSLSFPFSCDAVCQEGCQCDDGFVLNGNQCVPPTSCGCYHQGRYHQGGEQFWDGLDCPANSHYELCGTDCGHTCASSTDATCDHVCSEGCFCDEGFFRSGTRCVPVEECGCQYDGFYYNLGESFWTEGCSHQCKCHSPSDLRCSAASCTPTQLCTIRNGQLGCFDSMSTCTVWGDPHYVTFDGALAHFQGTCSYIITESVSHSTNDTWFQVNGSEVSVPTTAGTLAKVVRDGDYIVVDSSSLIVQFDGTSTLLLKETPVNSSTAQNMNGVARRTEFTVACLISNNNSEMRATVNQNGHLTFDGPWESYIPQRFPMYGLRDIIAPFWTNLINAQIYYNQYTGGSVLQQATEDISKYFSILNFNAKWVFVASWYEVAYYPTLERAGYDTINSTHYFMIPGSFSNSASGGNSNFHLSSNVNVPGRWAFHVGHVSGSCIFKGLQCVNQPCSFSQVCQPSAFQFSCQSVQKGLCTISGDPHYYTFDKRAFDFQGTCTYVLSEQCGGELSYYRVESKNEHRGSTHVSWTRLVKVHVYNETIELVKGQLGKVKVNGNFAGTPLYLYPRNGSIQVYESGFSIIVSTDFGLEVSYDTDHYVQISLPYTYQNSTCGLCGDFNNDPRDDFRTRQGQVVSSDMVFGNSWQTSGDDEPGCEAQCGGPDCAPCSEAKKTLYSASDQCGILLNSSGPFASCHQHLPPQIFVQNCVYDLCVGGGYQPILCQALNVYTSQCQQNGVQLPSWRRPGFCEIPCPANSHFETQVTLEKMPRGQQGFTWVVKFESQDSQVSIEITNSSKVQVDGQLIRLLFSSASNQIQIYYSSIHSVILRTSFGVTVQTVWPSFVRVTAPGVYNNSLAGLCGNYNGHPSDDFQTPNGTLVNSVQVFGDSWRNGFLSPQCVESRSSNSPTNTTEYCGILELSQGPFANCWEAVDRWEHVNICDNTVRTSNNPAVELCDILQDLALMCQQNGVVLGSWRNVTGCELTCPPNSHYELCGTSCPSTCPSLSFPFSCDPVCQEGCQCDEGFVLNGDQCVPPTSCGCYHQGRYHQGGEQFWDGEQCDSLCTCNGITGLVDCTPSSCGIQETCRVVGGEFGCHPNPHGVCSASGDPHYLTFDHKAYDFQGSCHYVLAAVCNATDGLPQFSVESKNEAWNGGSVSITAEVLVNVGGYQVRVSSDSHGVVQVNGVTKTLPVLLNGSSLAVFASGYLTTVKADFGLSVTYDGWSTVSISVPSNYSGKTCGLCGNFNGNPNDDFLTPSGNMVSTPDEFGTAWKVAGNYTCSDGCGSSCPRCINEEPARAQCEVIEAADGPFNFCHEIVDPAPYFNDCVFDVCVSGNGGQDLLCRAIQAYASACQSANVPIYPWRQNTTCRLDCPANSHYELCGSDCGHTCASSTDATCDHVCSEGCFCDEGFFRSGSRCVPVEECGCQYDGFYYNLGESFWTEGCSHQCKCHSPSDLRCSAASCTPTQLCTIRNGQLGCFDSMSTCTVWGDPHYVTFDGALAHFQGTCSYIITESVSHSTNDTWFQVNGSEVSVPTTAGTLAKVVRDGDYIVVDSSSLIVQFDGTSTLLVRVADIHQNRVSGMCGNFNGDPADDKALPNGTLAQNDHDFGNSWKAPTSQPGCGVTNATGLNDCPMRDKYSELCRVITNTSGPFSACHLHSDPQPFYASCVYDLCFSASASGILCSAVSAYEKTCSVLDVNIFDWQSDLQCARTDPCERENCTEYEWCGAKGDVYGCFCDEHSSHPNSDTYDSSITCVSSSGTISLSRCQLFEAGFHPNALHLRDKSCKGTLQEGRLVFHFNNDDQLCGTVLKSNGTHFRYENAILGEEGLNIQLVFSCEYLLTQELSMDLGINPIESSVRKELPSGQGRYYLRIIPYKDPAFRLPLRSASNIEMEMNQRLYVEVRTEGVDEREIATILDFCWATPVNNASYPVHHYLIIESCPNPADGTVELLQNGSSTVARFSFQIFTFTNFSSIYLHCQVNHNGHLTFDGPLSATSTAKFPVHGQRDVIAPFWTDLDNRQNGEIYYNQYTSGSVLQQATRDINTYFPSINFNANWVFVATWYEVAYYPTSGTAGYDTINSVYYVSIPGSFTSSASGSNSNFRLSSNVNVPGRWAYRTDSGSRGCTFNGESVQEGDSFWSDSTCAQKCTCTSTGLRCVSQPCSFSQVCQPSAFQFSCQSVQKGLCTISGDPHYYTFDKRAFDFQGTCTYVLSEQCGGELSYYRVESKNEHRGSTRVSWTRLVKVHVYNETIELVKGQRGKVKVNGNFASTPLYLYPRNGSIQVYESGFSIIVSTDFGLEVSYDTDHYVKISLPYTYQNSTCGLCGDFNNDPRDDFRTRQGQVVSSDMVFGNSWQASGDDEPGCEAQCGGLECTACTEAQTAFYSNNDHCGILLNSSGPFASCHQQLPPQTFVQNCVYDLCVGGGYQPILCQALNVYTSQCQQNGVQLPSWRRPGFCEIPCPANSHFETQEKLPRGQQGFARVLKFEAEGTQVSIEMTGSSTVQVDGQLIRLPYSSASNRIQIYHSSTQSIILRTSFGVTVQTVWPHFVRITAPGVYNGSLGGLCGDYNGLPDDDFRTPNGVVVNSSQVFGDSWRDGSLAADCVDTESCQCDGGFVLNGDQCVPPTACGCYHQGLYHQGGEQFWDGEQCDSLCTCNGTTGSVYCTPSSCGPQETCRVVGGKFGCHPNPHGTCSASGDPHYITFDRKAYDFQGTCRYVLSTLCNTTDDLHQFSVEAKNEPWRGLRVSIPTEVFVNVWGYQVHISRERPGVVQVNGVTRNLPILLNGSHVSIYASGPRVFVNADFGLSVTYDGSSTVFVSVPGNYRGKTCGLCGNFNGNPSDDFRTPSGTIVTSLDEFGTAWKVAGNYTCSDGCGSSCPQCTNEEPARAQCEVIQAADGPFSFCHETVDPAPYFNDCVFDVCVSGNGGQDLLCRAIQAYASACQSANVPIYPWRQNTTCRLDCPANSHYELCGTDCGHTCASSTDATCDHVCSEGCFCDEGFFRSGSRCVPVEECGCQYDGFYYNLGESFWTEGCSQQCKCHSPNDLRCSAASCTPTQLCTIRNGQLGCFDSMSTCTVWGDPHYVTFDGALAHFQGTCSYIITESVSHSTNDTWFQVAATNNHRGNNLVSFVSAVDIYLSNEPESVYVQIGPNKRVKVNGGEVSLPTTAGSLAQVVRRGSYIVVDAVDLIVQFDGQSTLLVRIGQKLENRVTGMCGNFNNDPADDKVLPNGTLAQNDNEFGHSWKSSTSQPGCGSTDVEGDGGLDDCPFKVEYSELCSVITNTSGPFSACHLHFDPQPFFIACVFDLCLYTPANGMLCSAVSAYEETCLALGLNIPEWRPALRCAETDPCEQLGCTEDEWCGEKDGVYGCFCDEHHRRPNNESYDSSITCVSSSGTMSLSRCQLFEAGFHASSLHLRENSCNGTLQDGRLVFHFNNDDQQCGTVLRSNGTHFLYENAIQGDVDPHDGLISREKSIHLEFCCEYPLAQALSMDVGINPVESIVRKKLPSGDGRYHLRMIPYEDSAFRIPLTRNRNLEMELDQRLYIEIQTEGVDERQISTILDSCWATPFNDASYPVRWDLITAECPDPADGTVELVQNGVSNVARFSFRMFTFTNFSSIYLHCQVHLCLLRHNNCTAHCYPGYHNRVVRDISPHDTTAISLGPLALNPEEIMVKQSSGSGLLTSTLTLFISLLTVKLLT